MQYGTYYDATVTPMHGRTAHGAASHACASALYVQQATFTISVQLLGSDLSTQVLYITGILAIGVAALRAVMSTALHASDWHRGKRCGFICVQARKSQVVQMAVQHNVCALLVADILLLLLFYTPHVYCVDPHRLGACVPSST
jgi:hypothetical protein